MRLEGEWATSKAPSSTNFLLLPLGKKQATSELSEIHPSGQLLLCSRAGPPGTWEGPPDYCSF